jgi:hypothetical protein
MLAFNEISKRIIFSLPPMAAKNNAFHPELQSTTSFLNADNIKQRNEYELVGMVNLRLSFQEELHRGITASAC